MRRTKIRDNGMIEEWKTDQKEEGIWKKEEGMGQGQGQGLWLGRGLVVDRGTGTRNGKRTNDRD